MSSKSEVGYDKTVTAFQNIVVHIEALGPAYNPSNPAITLAALQSAHANGRQALNGINLAKGYLNNAVVHRNATFDGLAKFGTRIVNALDAAGALPQTVAQARTILRKLQGGGRSKPKTPQAAETAPVNGETVPAEGQTPPATVRSISVSQNSFDNQAEHFARILVAVSNEPLYIPNEAELGLPALQSRLDGLRAANLAIQQNITAHENAIHHRNATLYGPDTGLTAIAADVKKYVCSLYGRSSPQYKTIAAIRLR